MEISNLISTVNNPFKSCCGLSVDIYCKGSNQLTTQNSILFLPDGKYIRLKMLSNYLELFYPASYCVYYSTVFNFPSTQCRHSINATRLVAKPLRYRQPILPQCNIFNPVCSKLLIKVE